MNYVTLNNGLEIPQLGYGVYQIDPAETEQCVLDALGCGYRLIDTAQAYANESEVGTAIAKSGVPREDVFVTSKVWVANANYERAQASIEQSVEKLGGYVDVMLLHQAYGDYHGAWRAMEEAYDQGLLHAIGVSNFDPVRLIDLCAFARIKPMLNQVETHPFWQQESAHTNMEALGVMHEAWAPFAEGAQGIFTNPLLEEIGQAHGKTVAQVILRWLLQRNIMVIPKTVKEERMKENIDVFDFDLTDDEMERIATLDGGKSLIFDHSDTKLIGWLLNDLVATEQLAGEKLY